MGIFSPERSSPAPRSCLRSGPPPPLPAVDDPELGNCCRSQTTRPKHLSTYLLMISETTKLACKEMLLSSTVNWNKNSKIQWAIGCYVLKLKFIFGGPSN